MHAPISGEKNDLEGYKGYTVMYGDLKQCDLLDHVMVNWGPRFINHGKAGAHKEMEAVTPWPRKGKTPTEERLVAFDKYRASRSSHHGFLLNQPYTKPVRPLVLLHILEILFEYIVCNRQ